MDRQDFLWSSAACRTSAPSAPEKQAAVTSTTKVCTGKRLPAGPEGRHHSPQRRCWRSHFGPCMRDAKRQTQKHSAISLPSVHPSGNGFRAHKAALTSRELLPSQPGELRGKWGESAAHLCT